MSEAIEVRRKVLSPLSTLGEMYGPDGAFWGFTLEDPCRNVKVPGKTAIPAGNYEVIVGWSPKYQRPMPRLLNVPYFDGILVHSGNTPEHSEGCLLVGRKADKDAIYESVLAFEEIFPKIKKLAEKGELRIQVTGGFEAQHWVKAFDPASVPVG